MPAAVVSDFDLIRIHGVVSEDVLRTTCELVDAALASAEGRVVDYLVLLNEALVAYKQHNWQLAVVAAWTVCEVLVDQDWTAFFMGSGKQINSTRRQLLQGPGHTVRLSRRPGPAGCGP